MDAAPPGIETVTVNAARPAQSHFWAGNGFSFHDLLDTINPLQHLPVVSTIYRAITGDRPGNVAEIVGDGLFGGLLGLAAGVANVALKEATGKDVGDTLLGLVSGDGKPPAAPDEPAPASPDAAARPVSGLARLKAVDTPPEPAAASADPVVPAAAPAVAAPGVKPLPAGRTFIPIDLSERGILAMRAASAVHSPAPVPLALPPGAELASAANPVDYSARMKDGLDKYDAMLARRTGALAGASVDQIH